MGDVTWNARGAQRALARGVVKRADLVIGAQSVCKACRARARITVG